MSLSVRGAVAAITLSVAASSIPGGATGQAAASNEVSTGQLTRGSNNPILRNDSSYDDLKAGPSTVVKVADADYRQWYEAIDADADPGPDPLSQTAYAVSADGTSWKKQGIVFSPMPPPSWERSEACPTSMHWDGSNWILFYHGGSNTGPRAIGRATSPTGVGSFTRDPANPILERGEHGAWDENFVADAKVIPPWEGPDDLWRMYYIGRDAAGKGRVGLATSKDGRAFTKYASNPVVALGAPGSWDDGTIHAFTVEWDDSRRRFSAWYVAKRESEAGGGIGYLWSDDGSTWNRSPENPVLMSIPGDAIADSIDSYVDRDRLRIVYGQFDLGASPPLRGKGEAWLAKEATSPLPDSSATFSVSAGSDDGDVERGSETYPPATDARTSVGISADTVLVRRSKTPFDYDPVRVGLLQFDTSPLPDDANVISAQLRLHIDGKSSTDEPSLVAEWYPASSWPIDSGDWTLSDGDNAHAGTPFRAIVAGAPIVLPLRNVGYVNPAGSTGLRLHVSIHGSAPTGPNDLAFASFDHASFPPPELIVEFTAP